MLSNDSVYQIEKLSPNDVDLNTSLYKLYQPIIGSDAVVLYMSLLSLDSGSFKELAEVVNQSLIELEKNREKLEEVDLIETYNNLNRYIIVIKSPKTPRSFLNDEVLGRYLFHIMGVDYYKQQKSELREINKSEYINISRKFNKEKLKDWNQEKELIFENNKNIRKIASFTHIDLYKNVSNVLFPLDLRTKENTELILQLADLYEISQKDILLFASKSINRENGLDIEKLKWYARKSSSSNQRSPKHKYDRRCDEFFASFQASGKIADSNKNAIEEIKDKYNFKNEIINVLIEYIIKNFNNSFNKGLLDHLAAQVDRANVYDYKSALDALKKYKIATTKNVDKNVNTNHLILNPKRTESIIIDSNDVDIDKLVEEIKGGNNNE